MQFVIIDGEHVPVDVVTLDAVPSVYALYNPDEETVAAWVVDLPGGSTRVLGDGFQVNTNLTSAATFWAAHLDAELVSLATPASLN